MQTEQPLLMNQDIKYRGPLSYRYLRALGWIAIAMSQLLVINGMAEFLLGHELMGYGTERFLFYTKQLAIPLFLLASFTIILNRSKTHKQMIIMYGGIYLAIAFGTWIFMSRYLISVLTKMSNGEVDIAAMLGDGMGSLLKFNIFADLFMLTLFNFFLNYTPKNHFQGKKLAIFRSFMIIPVLLIALSYTLLLLDGFNKITLPIQAYPFLVTKMPLMHLLFIAICFFMKNRESRFKKRGGTHEQYLEYLKTNKNSLQFSITVSVLFILAALIDYLGLVVLLRVSNETNYDKVLIFMDDLGIGQCFSLVLAAPFIMLFSYTRTHKKSIGDMIVPMMGITFIVFTYLEGIRYILMHLGQ